MRDTNKKQCRHCDRRHYGKGLCNKHWYREVYLGGALTRTTYDPNEIVVVKDYAEVILYDKKGKECDRTKIDKDDIERVSKHKWRSSERGYVHGKNTYLHQFIMRATGIDHINGDRKDNRKCNLRVVSQSQNLMNRRMKGYSKDKWGKFCVEIEVGGTRYKLGRYSTEKEAAAVRRAAELKHFGEFARRAT